MSGSGLGDMETNTAAPETIEKAQIRATSARLLFVSAAALFAEIMLIRWIGTEVRNFAFVQNLALIACFLGFGIGCFQKDQQPTLAPVLQALTVLVAMVSFRLHLWRLLLKCLSDFLSLSPDAALSNAYSIQPNQGRLRGLFFAIVVVAYLIALLSKMRKGDCGGRLVLAYPLSTLTGNFWHSVADLRTLLRDVPLYNGAIHQS
jgi:hypothetical protein